MFRDLCKQRYLISKHTHTSFEDTLNMTPTEAKLVIQFILEDAEEKQKALDELKTKNKG